MAELHPQIVEKITEQVLELLPQGSGINGKWEIKVTLNENYQYVITASNYFENEDSLEGRTFHDFTIHLLLISPIMSIMNKGKYKCTDIVLDEDDMECSDILEYLEDTVSQIFEWNDE